MLTADYERMCSEAAKIAKGDQATLRIGYLRDYAGCEFHRAIEPFSDLHPDGAVSVNYGNHEELYAMLPTGHVDLVFNDQRRAFSEAYVNLLLTTRAIAIKATPHNSSAALAMPFSPSAACRFLDLPPVNLRNLQLHLTKNSFATAPTHLCGVAFT